MAPLDPDEMKMYAARNRERAEQWNQRRGAPSTSEGIHLRTWFKGEPSERHIELMAEYRQTAECPQCHQSGHIAPDGRVQLDNTHTPWQDCQCRECNVRFRLHLADWKKTIKLAMDDGRIFSTQMRVDHHDNTNQAWILDTETMTRTRLKDGQDHHLFIMLSNRYEKALEKHKHQPNPPMFWEWLEGQGYGDLAEPLNRTEQPAPQSETAQARPMKDDSTVPSLRYVCIRDCVFKGHHFTKGHATNFPSNLEMPDSFVRSDDDDSPFWLAPRFFHHLKMPDGREMWYESLCIIEPATLARIEALTGVRLKDGQDPQWFIDEYEKCKNMAGGVLNPNVFVQSIIGQGFGERIETMNQPGAVQTRTPPILPADDAPKAGRPLVDTKFMAIERDLESGVNWPGIAKRHDYQNPKDAKKAYRSMCKRRGVEPKK